MNSQKLITALQVAVRSALAAGLSVFVAQLCKLPDPIYALIAAVIVSDLSPSRTRKLAVQRLAATVLGATIGAVLNEAVPPTPWSVGAGILIAMAASHFSRVPEGAKVAGYICGIVMLAHGEHSWSYAFFRFVDTALGIGVAWLVSMVPRLIRVAEPDPGHSPGNVGGTREGGARTRPSIAVVQRPPAQDS